MVKKQETVGWQEIQFDGLVGPTHHYAGLSLGNVASVKNRGRASNPRAAALQGLSKMRLMLNSGVTQGIIPPLFKPDLQWLQKLGFTGKTQQILDGAAKADEAFLACVFSAGSMWVANAATVCPSADSLTGQVHFTPANLNSTPHRRLEAKQTAVLLQRLFPSQNGFQHHLPLPGGSFADEGAANHIRLGKSGHQCGLQIFVHGKDSIAASPKHFPARQDKAASEAVCRLHQLNKSMVLHLRQNPKAIDAGVFHNDVASVGHLQWLLAHEDAFASGTSDFKQIESAYRERFGAELNLFVVKRRDLPLADAVSTYLFNSQIVTLPNQKLMMVCAVECKKNLAALKVLDTLQNAWSDLSRIEFVDLGQSMRNGGGPACLRLRVGLTQLEQQQIVPGALLNDKTLNALENWVEKHYRDRLVARDFQDASFVRELHKAYSALEPILNLPGLYRELECASGG